MPADVVRAHVPRSAGIDDARVLTEAIGAATAGNVSAFARLLDVGASSVFAWRAGTTPLPRDVRRTCLAILADPERVVSAYTVAGAA